MSDVDYKRLEALREPFEDSAISKLPKQLSKNDQGDKSSCSVCGGYHVARVIHLDYVGHAAVTARLLSVDPEWTWEPAAVDADGLPKFDANGGLWIRLTILGVTRLGYGDAQGKNGPNAVKEAIGDGIRNAAMRFGVALDLWSKNELPEPVPEYDDAGPLLDAVLAAPTVEDLQAVWQRIVSASLTRSDRTNLRAKTSARKQELEAQK